MSAKQGILNWLVMTKNKCCCQRYSTYAYAQLKAYWLACFTCMCNNMQFICSGTYICNVAGIFSHGHMTFNVKCMYISACGDIGDCSELYTLT